MMPMTDQGAAAVTSSGYRHGNTAANAIDRAVLKFLRRLLERSCTGSIAVTLPSGHSAMFGDGVGAASSTRLYVRNYRCLWSVFRRGQLGFAESYLAGDIDTDDLLGLFRFFMDNEPRFATAAPGIVASGWHDRLYHRLRDNSRRGSKRNIAAHYDLGNAFYKLWLDDGLTYSSGIYASPSTTLEAAQREKYDRILAGLDLQPGDHVLEIGCGWGGFAEAAGKLGANVTAITISAQQFAEASARIERASLADTVGIRLQDYRDTTGIFDHIASVEMVEAVGEAHWRTYFRTISDRLKPGGTAVIQAITIREDLFDQYRCNPDFIQRYVFPGGMLPTKEALRDHARGAGLDFEILTCFGHSYALTLADWRRRFLSAWPQIEGLGFDRRFRRLWEYYLFYCQVGFERKSVDVGLYRLTKTK